MRNFDYAGLALLVTAIVGGYIQLRNIHKAVNSNMTKALNDIKELNDRVAELVEEKSQRKGGK